MSGGANEVRTGLTRTEANQKRKELVSCFLREQNTLNRYAKKLVKHNEDKALDLVQDTLLKALEYLDNFSLGTNMMGWLITIMKNHYITQKRLLKNKALHYTLNEDMKRSESLSPFDSLNSKQELDLMQFLSPHQNRALTLSGLGYTIKQIAQKENTQLGTIKSRISRGRDLLQKYINGEKIMRKRNHLTIDQFISLKRDNGRLMQYTICEGGAWLEWTHEFGFPEIFHSLRFSNGWLWDEINGLRVEGGL